MSIDRFLFPRLTGARFEDHSIPLEFLKDLAVLEEMIIEVAKAEFKKEHPERMRSPRGFTEGIQFKLSKIEDGSAVPVISLVFAATTLFPTENEAYFERARDAVISAIGAAEQNESPTAFLPENTLGYFDRVGRSLRDGEAFEFSVQGRESHVRLTRETRRRLLLASSAVRELTEEHIVRGTVPEADQDDMTFEIQLLEGRKIKAPIVPQHLDTLLDAFKGYKSGTRILLQGIGCFDRNNRLQKFESVEHVSILDPLDIPARIDELRVLKDGWFEGAGTAPPKAGLDWLSNEFSQRYSDELDCPHLYPTVDGGIRAEWSLKPHEASLEVDLVSHRGCWHDLNMTTDAEVERELNLNRPDDWQWLIEQIQQMAGGAA